MFDDFSMDVVYVVAQAFADLGTSVVVELLLRWVNCVVWLNNSWLVVMLVLVVCNL